jgi:hypothetical protein
MHLQLMLQIFLDLFHIFNIISQWIIVQIHILQTLNRLQILDLIHIINPVTFQVYGPYGLI